MNLTENQQRFIQEQMALWTGAPQDLEIPNDLADLILGVTETQMAQLAAKENHNFQHNPLFWSGELLDPVVNQWLADKTSRNPASPAVPLWPEGKKFAVCLTHDVDYITLNSPIIFRQIGTTLQHFLQRKGNSARSLIRCLKLSLKAAFRLGAGPERFFEPWLEAEDRFGFRSTFFFFPDRASVYHPEDGIYYHYHDKVDFYGVCISTAQLMRELDRQGWEVGLHGTFASFRDPVELRKQKKQLERCLQRPVVSIRQHCLQFDMHHTPISQNQAGFKYDTTFGFNRIIGFRNGLAMPFYHYNLKADAPLPILQIPLQVQDGALLREDNLDLSPEEALARSRELIAKVEKIGGLVTLLWHPREAVRKYSGWLWVYQELLADLATRDAWVAPVREVGEWWQERRVSLTETAG
jgi:hypothetical protein